MEQFKRCRNALDVVDILVSLQMLPPCLLSEQTGDCAENQFCQDERCTKEGQDCVYATECHHFNKPVLTFVMCDEEFRPHVEVFGAFGPYFPASNVACIWTTDDGAEHFTAGRQTSASGIICPQPALPETTSVFLHVRMSQLDAMAITAQCESNALEVMCKRPQCQKPSLQAAGISCLSRDVKALALDGTFPQYSSETVFNCLFYADDEGLTCDWHGCQAKGQLVEVSAGIFQVVCAVPSLGFIPLTARSLHVAVQIFPQDATDPNDASCFSHGNLTGLTKLKAGEGIELQLECDGKLLQPTA